jgi:hypothetical protein
MGEGRSFEDIDFDPLASLKRTKFLIQRDDSTTTLAPTGVRW